MGRVFLFVFLFMESYLFHKNNKEGIFMKEIKSTADLKKHIFESAIKEDVQAGADDKGKFILVKNHEDIALADTHNKKNIDKGIAFKVYKKGGRK